MTEIDLNRYIRDLVRLCTGMTGDSVRPANKDMPTTGALFATVFIMTGAKEGQDSQSWADIAGDPALKVRQTVEGQRRITASVQFFRAGARDMAAKLETRIQMFDAVELMRTYGLGFIQTSAIRNVPSVVNSAWEERAQIDVDFYLVTTETADVPTYGDFRFSVTTEPLQSQPSYTQSSEVFEP